MFEKKKTFRYVGKGKRKKKFLIGNFQMIVKMIYMNEKKN